MIAMFSQHKSSGISDPCKKLGYLACPLLISCYWNLFVIFHIWGVESHLYAVLLYTSEDFAW